MAKHADIFSENKNFAEFEKRFGLDVADDVLQKISEAGWSGNSYEGVTILDKYTHNACNHTYSGIVEHEGERFGFIIESGDWNGTVIRSWGDPEDVGIYNPGPPPEPLTFVPVNDTLSVSRPEMFRVYAMWRKEPWFKEMERSYNYDRHFQPGGKIESHYREKAAKRGMKPGFLSNFTEEELAIIKEYQ